MRVLAITGNASLVVALGSMMRDWEVVSVRNVQEAVESAHDAVVALIDLGDTTHGVEVADQLYRGGITIPCVVIGDVDTDHPRASVLVRPFSLEDLGSAVKVAAERAAAAASAPAPREPAPPPAPPAEEPPVPPVSRAQAAGRAPSRSKGAGAPAAATVPETPPEPEKQPGRRGGLTVVRPDPETVEEPAYAETSASDVATPVVEESAAEPVPEAPARSTADYVRSQLEETAAYEQAPPAPPPSALESTPPQAPAARVETPAPAEPAQPAARVETPAPGEPAQPSARWRRKRRGQEQPAATQETESPLVRRLRSAATWAREIEALLEELPVLQDLWTLADALVAEVETQFAAQIVSVFTRGEDGYHAVAQRGLSRVEAGMVVPETQPLFSDVISTQEGILIQPVDLAQGLVSGIGGARTEAMMAAPIIVEGQCIAVVVVGGDRFAESDLDRLSDLANEAAPGLAVARLLQRLGGRDRS